MKNARLAFVTMFCVAHLRNVAGVLLAKFETLFPHKKNIIFNFDHQFKNWLWASFTITYLISTKNL